MSQRRNRNDIVLKNVSALGNEIRWNKYKNKDCFSYLCKVLPEIENEQLVIKEEDKKNIRKPCVYVLVIEGYIFKIGKAEGTSSRGGFIGRIGSYNCGKHKYRKRGTNSTTNFWVLQSLLAIGKEITVYAHFSNFKTTKIFGEKKTLPFPMPKNTEGVVIKQFEKAYGKKPIGNTQG